MIFFDVETTDLIHNAAAPLHLQPFIIEIGALKTDIAGVEEERFEALIKPLSDKPLDPIITQITGLTDADLKDAPIFIEVYGALWRFFSGETTLLAHNAIFDWQMLQFELRRVAKEFNFCWPREIIDTRTRWPGALQKWGHAVRGEDYVQKHRALEDCLLLRDCWFSGVGDV